MILTILSSLQGVLKLFSPAQLQLHFSSPAAIIVNLISDCFDVKDETVFWRSIELIIAKSFRVLMYLIDPKEPLAPEILTKLVKFSQLIPDDVRYFHIQQNFMLIACLLGEKPELVSQATTYSQTILGNCPCSCIVR
jgi:hypothetical protein